VEDEWMTERVELLLSASKKMMKMTSGKRDLSMREIKHIISGKVSVPSVLQDHLQVFPPAEIA
tara:strand:+ start:830 stop:1018 length:189 start_codon:yes stop_codon:yes gene_type:complete